MLERTAASLESCSIQRVLARPTRTTRRRRQQLHTGFWQHGASAIELSSLWPVPLREPEALAEETSASSVQSSLVASAFLLDFLYPVGARTFLRQLYSSRDRSRDGNDQSPLTRKRRFASSPAVEQVARPAPHRLESRSFIAPSISSFGLHKHNTSGQSVMVSKRCVGTQALHDALEQPSPELDPEQGETTIDTSVNNETKLEWMLSHPEEQRFQDLWAAFSRVEAEQRQRFIPQMVGYLAQSHNAVDLERASSLFRRVPVDRWDNSFLENVVAACLRSGDLNAALTNFRTGQDASGLNGGLDRILAYTISHKNWGMALDAWVSYYETSLQRNPDSTPDLSPLYKLQTIPGLGGLYLAFERYMATNGATQDIENAMSSTATKAAEKFRRMIAEKALQQPCSVKQAIPILESCNDPRLYHAYLRRMLRRWRRKEERKINLALLGELYHVYREFPDAKPNKEVLKDLFELFFPDNTSGIEELYMDWLQHFGSLDSHAYEQFLTYYSKTGDVGKVTQLWEDWVKRFPKALQSRRAFRSLLNVYAQNGDSDAVEAQLKSLREKYGFEPDTTAWNALLKSHVKAGHDADALECFRTIREKSAPDSLTYSNIITTAARKGDVKSASEYLRMAQDDGVRLSGKMCSSLIWAYCEQGQFDEAERICLQLTKRGAADAKAWNTLLHFNSLEGRLHKCYELFNDMRLQGVDWNSDSYEFLLQAMAQAGQLANARAFLQKAHEQRLFPLEPQHFDVVMSRAAQVDPGLVTALGLLMDQAGVTKSFAVQVNIVQAAHKAEAHSSYAQLQRAKMLSLLQQLAQEQGTEHGVPKLPRDSRALQRQTHNIGRAIHLLAEVRDFQSLEKLITAYKQLFPHSRDGNTTSVDVSSALMEAFLSEGFFEKVHELWQGIWQQILAKGLQKESGRIYPAYEYSLCRPLNIMIQTFRAQNDGKGLLKCIEQVVEKGFKLTSRIWNLALLELVYMGQWKAAMQWCETMLMPHWRGWGVLRTSSQEKAYFRNNRVLNPSRKVVLALQAEWLDLYRLAAWSPDISRSLVDLKRKFPHLHHAFTQSEYMKIEGQWIFEGKVDVTESIDRWLSRLSREQLRTLGKDLSTSLDKRGSKALAQSHKEIVIQADKPEPLRRKAASVKAVVSRTNPARIGFSFPPSMSKEQMAVLLNVVREELTERASGESRRSSGMASRDILEKLRSSLRKDKTDEEKRMSLSSSSSSSLDRVENIGAAPESPRAVAVNAHLMKRYPLSEVETKRDGG